MRKPRLQWALSIDGHDNLLRMRSESPDDDVGLSVARVCDEKIHNLFAFDVAGSRFDVRG